MRRAINLLQLRPLCLPTGRSAGAGSIVWPTKKTHFIIQPKWLDDVNIYDASPEVVGFTEGAEKRLAAGPLIEADSDLCNYLQLPIV